MREEWQDHTSIFGFDPVALAINWLETEWPSQRPVEYGHYVAAMTKEVKKNDAQKRLREQRR